MALELIKLGADEICIKDMAGIGRPVSLGKIVANIKEAHPEVPVQYHSHAGPGFNMASILEVCNAGCDYIDVGMEPLSWGTGHADLLSVQAMLKDAGFQVPEINMEAYMKVRSLVQEFMDDFLGLYISPKNRLMNSLLIGPGLPGGMMGSLMADLEANLESINKYKAKHNLPFMTQDELLIKLFNEVAYVWPRVGYPPLVTPFSQYVKNLAMMNVMAMEKGKERWGMIADDIWDMLLGKAGRLPGQLAPEIIEKAEREGRKFFEGNPQENYPDALDKYRKLMKENKWELGQDEEELFEYAMHPAQYEAYKSGKAKEDFLEDVAKRRAERDKAPEEEVKPKTLTVQVDGQAYRVTVAYGEAELAASGAQPVAPLGEGKEVLSPLEGKFFLTKNASDTPLKVGDAVQQGDVICYVEAMKTYNAIRAEFAGTVTAIGFAQGDAVSEDDVLMKIG
jgi:pyruvate carboxylase subunit B